MHRTKNDITFSLYSKHFGRTHTPANICAPAERVIRDKTFCAEYYIQYIRVYINIKKGPSIPCAHTAASTRRAVISPHAKVHIKFMTGTFEKEAASRVHSLWRRDRLLNFVFFTLNQTRRDNCGGCAAKWQHEALFLRATHLSSVWLTPAFFRLRRSQSAAPANKRPKGVSVYTAQYICVCPTRNRTIHQAKQVYPREKNKRW